MNIGLYQSASSLTALERWQDVVTQNITASQVSGYKKRTVGFEALPLGELQPDPKGKIGNGAAPSAYFPSVRFGVNFQNGETFPTRRPMDVALNGDGFFVVQLPDGRKGFTRSGALSVRQDRTVVAGTGQPILSDSGNPLSMSPSGGEVSINQDGLILQNGNVIGKLGVVKFDNLNDLLPLAGGLFVAKPGVDPVNVAKPEIMQGQIEASNVSSLREMVSLVNITRAYEANQKVITSQDQTLEKALQTLG